MKKTVTFDMPVSVTWEEALGTPEAAVEDFYRMLGEAEDAGFMDRQIIDIGYGGPLNVSEPQAAAEEEI